MLCTYIEYHASRIKDEPRFVLRHAKSLELQVQRKEIKAELATHFPAILQLRSTWPVRLTAL